MTRVTIGPWLPLPQLDLPEEAAEFAVGDVHGCLPQFAALTEAMAAEAAGRHPLTLLGDLLDRGPDSLGCLSHAAALLAGGGGFPACHLLAGNHELLAAAALAAAEPAAALAQWELNGGGTVLAELGLPMEAAARPGALAAALGEGAALLRHGWITHRRAGNLLFVHAGIHPGAEPDAWFARDPLDLEGGEEAHFAWIRWPALAHEDAFPGGCVVVHGHTPERSVQSWKGRSPAEDHLPAPDGWRLGLDGGSWRTGVVLGAELRRGRCRILRAAA